MKYSVPEIEIIKCESEPIANGGSSVAQPSPDQGNFYPGSW